MAQTDTSITVGSGRIVGTLSVDGGTASAARSARSLSCRSPSKSDARGCGTRHLLHQCVVVDGHERDAPADDLPTRVQVTDTWLLCAPQFGLFSRVLPFWTTQVSPWPAVRGSADRG